MRTVTGMRKVQQKPTGPGFVMAESRDIKLANAGTNVSGFCLFFSYMKNHGSTLFMALWELSLVIQHYHLIPRLYKTKPGYQSVREEQKNYIF